jgi:hypothetical protein
MFSSEHLAWSKILGFCPSAVSFVGDQKNGLQVDAKRGRNGVIILPILAVWV